MKSIFRSRLAAAALVLSPVALVAQPAHAQLADVLPSLIAQVIVNDAYRHDRVAAPRHHDGRRWDQRAPRITQLTPEPGDRIDRGRTTVGARFHDRASGVNPASVRLRIDGRDVTHAARIRSDGIRFRDRLRPGRHVAEVIVSDHAGNTARRAWQFVVPWRGQQPDRGYGYGYGYGRGYDDGRWNR